MNKNEESSSYSAKYSILGMEDFDDLLSGTSLDKARSRPHHEDMSTVSREEFNAKLETIEVKMDARVASIESKLDLFLANAAGAEKSLQHLAEKAVFASESAASSAERAGGLKSTMWITSITTIIAVVGIAFAAYFGTQQSNQGIVQTTLSAYEMGRGHSGTNQPALEKVPEALDKVLKSDGKTKEIK